MDSISEQKRYLSEHLIVESLRLYDINQKEIQGFRQTDHGTAIEQYLKRDAWEEDANNDTKIFLIRDKKTRQIVFFYALNCGILYKESNAIRMSALEEECVQKFITAQRLANRRHLRDEEKDMAYGRLQDAYDFFEKKIPDETRRYALLNYAQEQADLKEEREEAEEQIGEDEFTKNVQKTYPAIDIKFLCRDANYKPEIEISFKFGVYVFWEIVVPHILKISKLTGCKYVYLFAADRSEVDQDDAQTDNPAIYGKDYDADDAYDSIHLKRKNEEDIRKLVSYYQNDLKFRPVSEFTILKPHFERSCYAMIQEVTDLERKRESIWESHA